MTMKKVTEAINTPIRGAYDVIVAGAGPAGISAAIAAARSGARVLLIEANGCLGGVWTAGLLTWVFDIEKNIIGGEIIGRLQERSACVMAPGENMQNFSYDVESMKYLLDDMCLSAGIDILLHARVVATELNESRKLTHLMTESESGREAWAAHAFIDCTGNGSLGALAGNRFAMGNEDGETQPMTFMGLIAVPSLDAVSEYISFYGGEYNHLECCGRFSNLLRDLGIETSYGHPTLFQLKDNLLALMVNHEYGFDATNTRDLTKATMSGRGELNRVVDGLSSSEGPFRGAVLVSSAEHIGIREGRRLKGLYEVVYEDLITSRQHEDAVCTVRFNIDIHSTKKSKSKGLKTEKTPPYQIPLRALIAHDVDGLLMAGRCISGDFLAHASYRVTGEAVSMGEAAGVCAAISARTGSLPRQVRWTSMQAGLAELAEKCHI